MPKCSDCGAVKREKEFPVREVRNGITFIKNPCKACLALAVQAIREAGNELATGGERGPAPGTAEPAG